MRVKIGSEQEAAIAGARLLPRSTGAGRSGGVRARAPQTELGSIRLRHAVERGAISYRKGPVLAIRHREHQSAGNLVCLFASDERNVDMIRVCGVIFRRDGSEA